MVFYGIWIEFINDIGGGIQSQVLRSAFRSRPTQEQIDSAVKKWAEDLAIAVKEKRALYKVSKIQKVKVIDFVLED